MQYCAISVQYYSIRLLQHQSRPEHHLTAVLLLQRLAREEDDETAVEINDLQDEADMPIEQLLARYGYTVTATPVESTEGKHETGPAMKSDKAPGLNQQDIADSTEKQAPVMTEDDGNPFLDFSRANAIVQLST